MSLFGPSGGTTISSPTSGMTGGGIGSIIGGIGTAIGSIVGAGLNYSSQQDNLNYQKWVQKQAWKREDSAVYRKVRDLRNSGLSPTLAAGAGAQAGPVVSTQAPQMGDFGMSDAAQLVMAMLQQKANIAKTNAEKDLINLQKDGVKASNIDKQLDNIRKAKDIKIESETGTHSKPSWVQETVRDFQNHVQNLFRNLSK